MDPGVIISCSMCNPCSGWWKDSEQQTKLSSVWPMLNLTIMNSHCWEVIMWRSADVTPAAPLEGKQAAEDKRRKARLFRGENRKMCGWCVSGTAASSHMNPILWKFITSCCHMFLRHSGLDVQVATFCSNYVPNAFTFNTWCEKHTEEPCAWTPVSSFHSRVPGNVLNQTASDPQHHWETLSLCRHTKHAVRVCWVLCPGLMRDYPPTHLPPLLVRCLFPCWYDAVIFSPLLKPRPHRPASR